VGTKRFLQEGGIPPLSSFTPLFLLTVCQFTGQQVALVCLPACSTSCVLLLPEFMGWYVASSVSGSGIRGRYHATHIIYSPPWQRTLSVLTDLSERTLSICAQSPCIIICPHSRCHEVSHMANCLSGWPSSWLTVLVVSPLLTDIHRMSSCLFEGVVGS